MLLSSSFLMQPHLFSTSFTDYCCESLSEDGLSEQLLGKCLNDTRALFQKAGLVKILCILSLK